MKDIVLQRASRNDPHDLRFQTRPSGDIEVVRSKVSSSFPHGSIVDENMPTNEIIGVIPRERLAEVIEWLQQVE